MTSPDQLCDEPQASRLFDALQMHVSAHGFGIGAGVSWYMGHVVLPEMVRERSEIAVEQAEGYSVLAFAPRLIEDDKVHQLFGDRNSDVLPATINFRQRSEVEVHSPRPDIQYRLRQNSNTGLTELDKFYLGEPVDFGVLDEGEKGELRQKQTAELLAELSDLPDEEADVGEKGFQRILGAIGGILGRELDETLANRENADQLARALGLTAVYTDEAESLIDFFESTH